MRVFRQKGCKTYRVRFSIGTREFDLPLKTRNKEVADSKARELVRETEMEIQGLRAPRIQRDVALTPLVELLNEWLQNGLSPEVTPKHRSYSEMRPTRVFEACDWKYLRDITPGGFESWRAAQRRAGVKPKTLNEYLAHIRTFLNWLEEREMIGLNPLRSVKKLKVVREELQRAFTLEELERLVETVPPYRACLYTIAAYTGLRRTELASLEWGRVVLDHDKRRINLSAAKTKNRKGGFLPIHPTAVEAFDHLREVAPQDNNLVFFQGVTRMERFKKDLDDAGIPQIDSIGRKLEFHSLRRTLATFLNCAGVPPRVAMELMRHSDMKLTLRDYTDQSQLPLVAALNEIPSLKSSPISSLKSGKACPNVSTIEKVNPSEPPSEVPEREGVGLRLAAAGQLCPNMGNVHGEGFEPPTAWV